MADAVDSFVYPGNHWRHFNILDEVPFNKGEDNFWMHGFFVGVAAAPIAYATGHWWLFLLRCAILCIWSGVWSRIWKWDVAEESGRLLPLIPTLYMIA